MEFDEISTADNITKIHFYVFTYNQNLKGTLTTSEEIENFKWYTSKDNIPLSNTLKHKVIPYCLEKGLIK